MMMGSGWGMGVGGWGGWIAMAIFWVGLAALVVWLISRAFLWSGDREHGYPDADRGGDDTSERTLDRRFAAGEIDGARYQEMRESLRSGRSSDQSHR